MTRDQGEDREGALAETGRGGESGPRCVPLGALSIQALQALCGERAHGLSDHAVPCEGSEQGLSAPPQSAVRLSWREREVLGPAGPLRVWFPEP